MLRPDGRPGGKVAEVVNIHCYNSEIGSAAAPLIVAEEKFSTHLWHVCKGFFWGDEDNIEGMQSTGFTPPPTKPAALRTAIAR